MNKIVYVLEDGKRPRKEYGVFNTAQEAWEKEKQIKKEQGTNYVQLYIVALNSEKAY